MPDTPRLSLGINGGMNTVDPPDELKPGQYPVLVNVRAFLGGRVAARPPLGSNLLASALPSGITSLTRVNDPYMGGAGYVLVLGAAGNMYVNASQIASGFSGSPLSFLPYTPPDSPQPWCYIADPSLAVTIPSYSGYSGPVTGMVKVRSDGTCYKIGIMEPQAAPSVATSPGGGPNWVSYRYTYWSDEGAESNPSPPSAPQTIPQTSVVGTEGATSSSVSYNSAQYEVNGSQLRTTGSVSPGTVTDYVIAKNFGLSVPSGVKIDGVQAAMSWVGQYAGTGIISGVALYYQGGIIGQIKAPGTQNSQTSTTITQGGNSDSWGTVLTPDIVNDSTFGIGFQITTAEASGSDRSFINNFTLTVYYTTLSATLTATPSSDPQVKSINIYRQDPGLPNFTFVGRVPNSAPNFTDTLTDLAVANNPQLSFANFEPFPSIDLPRKGTLTVGANGACTWDSGDTFNTRWLPGTLILIDNGSGSQIAYELYNRPTSTTAMKVYSTAIDPTTGYLTISYPPAGSNLAWEITAPTLAAEPSPVIWGPTPDNAGSFYFGLDPLNPGDLVWSMGNNFDSAPDTNRLYVTSASEPLMNGTVTSELSTVFSTERFWLIYSNFADAVATVTGTQGQQWTLVQSAATRGLYMRYAIGALGSLIAWRAKDGICLSQGGGPEKMISESIRNLFPQGGQTPSAVTIGGQTVYPPDDTRPNAQTITIVPGYIFYNYQDSTGTPRTLCYDVEAKGWVVDTYSPTVNCHAWAVGEVFQILAGCTDGTARALDSAGTETATAVIATGCQNDGDFRAFKRLNDLFFRGIINDPVSLALWVSRYSTQLSGFSPTSLTGTGQNASYIVNLTDGDGADIEDVAAVLSWAVGSGNILNLWDVNWTKLPDTVQDRPTDWTDAGFPGNKLIRGFILEMDTFNAAKALSVERSDSDTLITPDQSPVTANGQTLVPFTFTPPFVAHDLRIVSTDGVSWRRGPDAGWSLKWIADPWPDYTPLKSAWMNLGTDGAKYLRGMVVPMDTNGAQATFKVVTSDGASVTFTATTNAAVKTPVAFAFDPPIIAHEVQIQCESNAAIWSEEIKWIFDPYPEITPEYTPIMETGGSGNKYVRGVTLTADTANEPVQFQVLYDGGKTGPTFTATFNGKQTVAIPFDAPFIAHDIQIVPQAKARIFIQESQWIMEKWSEYITLYSPWMNLGTDGAKYLRALILPLDTKGVEATFEVVTSDGASVSFTATTTIGMKTQVPFAFDPPIVAHEIQIRMQSNAAMWPEEAKWDFDKYPEIIPEYTSIMEIGGPDNKFMQGIKLTADTGNQPVTFQVLYDGGQAGPSFTGTFNGKQTKVFSWTPFQAHDVQLVPQGNARIWTDVSKWEYKAFAESQTLWQTEMVSFGLKGWLHIPWLRFAYQSSADVTLNLITDQGVTATLTIPSSGGVQAKYFTWVPAIVGGASMKFKMMSFEATSSAPFNVFAPDLEVAIKQWGSTGPYQTIRPLGGPTQGGAEV